MDARHPDNTDAGTEIDARITERTEVSATIEVDLPPEAVDAAFERVFASLTRSVRVPGFRPGRAPRGVLLQRVGAQALAEEVRETLVDAHVPKVVQQLGLTLVHAHTHADLPVEKQAFRFVVHADLYPEFELPDVDAIAIDTAAAPIGDDDVAATVARLREDHATLVPVERPVEAGDVVFVETQGEGGGQVMPVDLERTEEALVAQLLGRSVGDELVLDLGEDPRPPAASDDAGSAGSDGDAGSAGDAASDTNPSAGAAGAAEGDPGAPVRRSLAVKLTDVKAKDRPETDDAFAATLGFATWAEVDAEIRRGLGVERQRETRRAQRDELVEKIMRGAEVPLPATLVRRRQGHLLEDLVADLQRRGLTLEAYLKRLDERDERESFERELREAAERGVKRDLLLERLLEARGTRVSDAELDAAIRQAALRERKDPVRFRKDQGETWAENLRFLMARDKALDEIVRAKTGTAADGGGPPLATEGGPAGQDGDDPAAPPEA